MKARSKARRYWCCTLLALLVTALPAQPQDDKDGAARAPESLADWRYSLDIHAATDKAEGGFFQFVAPATVFGKAGHDLHDLRLYDARSREVPHALRILHGKITRDLLPAHIYNRTQQPDGTAEVWLDLREKTPEYNELEIELRGANFRRPFRLEGGDKEGEWRTLFDGHVIRYEYAGQRIDVRRFAIPASRYRYLRLVVRPDAAAKVEPDAGHTVSNVQITRFVETLGQDMTVQADLAPREAAPTPEGPGSAWFITFGGAAPPCGKLFFDIDDDDFARRYVLERVHDDGRREFLTSGEWWRRPGSERAPMQIQLRETQSKRLRLVVTDQRNAPLQIRSVQASAAARQIVFAAQKDLGVSPLKLYFGNDSAKPAGYDLARNLPARLEPLQEALVGDVEENPIYQPPPVPWTERWQGGIYVALALASAALLGLLGLLGREAMRKHDAISAPQTKD